MIHPTAIIDPKAKLGAGASVGPYAVIEEGVVLGAGVTISASAHIRKNTSIGDNTFIGIGAVIGEAPQMLGVTEILGRVVIGKNNIIREYVTIHASTAADKITSIGNSNFFMAFSHVAHDCHIGNNVVLCNGVLVAGHVEIGDRAFISGNVVIHQNVRIGRIVMVGGLSRVNQDIPPFMLVVGDSSIIGINVVGLRRAGFSADDLGNIKKAYSFLCRQQRSIKGAVFEMSGIDSDKVREIADFIASSKRGISGPRRNGLWGRLFLDYPYLVRSKIESYGLFSQMSRIRRQALQEQSPLA